jgi:hypothetical protein
MLSYAEQERERIKRLKEQMREQERLRFANPDRDKELEGVWVAHLWVPDDPRADKSSTEYANGEWIFAGFRRRRHRRKPQTMNKFFAKVRRQLGLQKETHVMLMDMSDATLRLENADEEWRTRAPQRQAVKRKLEQRMPALLNTDRKKRRVYDKAIRFHKRESKFIALGRNTWTRERGHLFLGPLDATTANAAILEAQRKFPVYVDLIVAPTDELSPPLRESMHRGKKVRAGVTRIVWPEVPPTFEEAWDRMNDKRRKVRAKQGVLDDLEALHYAAGGKLYKRVHTVWHMQVCPWLTPAWLKKQIQKCSQPKPLKGEKKCAPKRKAKPAKRKVPHSRSKTTRASVSRKKSAPQRKRNPRQFTRGRSSSRRRSSSPTSAKRKR